MGSGRNIPRAARKNAAYVLSRSDLCHLCGHHGARTADHIISARDWPRGPDGRHLPGLDDVANLAPAHGTIGSTRLNRCPTCGRLCNQARGASPLPTATRQPW
jgi:hypothetical protein